MSMNLAAPIVVGTLLEPSPARASTVPLVAARRSAPQLLVDVEAALARARALPRTGPAYVVAAALSGALAIALPLAYLLAVAAFFAGGAGFAFVAVALASPLPSTLFAIVALGFASAGLVTAWPVVAMLTRGKRREQAGIALTESNEPLLVGLVEAVARAVQVPVPDRIELAPGADASIDFRGDRVTLRLGAALLTTLSVAELVAVVAHELGHARQGTARRITLFVHHTATWMLASAMALTIEDASSLPRLRRRNWSDTLRRVLLYVVLLPLSLVARLADALVMALAREQERDADVVAAAIAGHPHVASSLARICAASAVIDDVIADAAHGGPCIDDLARFAAVRIEGLTAAQRKSMARKITRDGAGVVHPTYDDRVSDVIVVAKPAAALPQDAAANLVRDLSGLSKRATEAHWRSMIAMPELVDTDVVLEQRARGAATVTRGLPRFLR